MQPTSKIINTFMVQGSDPMVTNMHLIAHCEDGSIWRTADDIMWINRDEKNLDWECVLQAPENVKCATMKEEGIESVNNWSNFFNSVKEMSQNILEIRKDIEELKRK